MLLKMYSPLNKQNKVLQIGKIVVTLHADFNE